MSSWDDPEILCKVLCICIFLGERIYNFHQILKSTCKPPSLDPQKGKKYCRAHYPESLSPSLGKAWKLGIELKSSLAFFLNFLHMCGLMCLRRVLQQVNNSVLSLLLHLSYIDLWEIIILSKSNASHCQFGNWCLVKSIWSHHPRKYQRRSTVPGVVLRAICSFFSITWNIGDPRCTLSIGNLIDLSKFFKKQQNGTLKSSTYLFSYWFHGESQNWSCLWRK